MRVGVPLWRHRDGPGGDLNRVLDPAALEGLIAGLRRRGFTPIGPTVRQGAICYDELESAADLPAGWTDEQDGGTYRLRRSDDGAIFDHNVGANSWKSHLFPPTLTLWKAQRNGDGSLRGRGGGDRAAALRVHRRPLLRHARDRRAGQDLRGRPLGRPRLQGPPRGRVHRRRQLRPRPGARASASRWRPARKASFGFDLALTELLDEDGHRFLVEVGSERGAEVLAELETRRGRGRRRAGRRPGDRARRPPTWAARSTPPTSGTCSTATATTRAGTRSPTAASPAATARSPARPASAAAWRT